jgi:hypothetical protein
VKVPAAESNISMAKQQKKEDALATVEPAGAIAAYEGYADEAGEGFEEQTADDYAVPFITILQALSPQCKERRGECFPGDLYNTVIEERYDGSEGIIFVPVYTNVQWVEWVPRDKGGGLVDRFDPNSDVVARAKARAEAEGAKFGKYTTEAGNDLVETHYVYGLHVMDGDGMPALISFKSTAIKAKKSWITKARYFTIKGPDGKKFNPPLYSCAYRLRTFDDKRAKGDFSNWSINFEGGSGTTALIEPGSKLHRAAVAFRNSIKAGGVKMDAEVTTQATQSDGEDIPF